MDSAEPDPALVPDSVGMCYVVVTSGASGRASGELRVRFEFRDDLSGGRRESRTVLGVGAACDTMREWLVRMTG